MSADCKSITKQLLKNRSGEFDVESIHTIVLKKLDLTNLGCLGECAGLEQLDLSYNEITNLYALAGLTNLTHLNLAANKISSLEGLQSLDNLTCLNLAGNLIDKMDALNCLSGLEKLVTIRLKDYLHELTNPVCSSKTYKQKVKEVLPKLVSLDGERLTGKGSDLFIMCEELEELIKERDEKEPFTFISRAKEWVSGDYWISNEAEKSHLADAENDLELLLAECKRVTLTADDTINTFRGSLGQIGNDKFNDNI